MCVWCCRWRCLALPYLRGGRLVDVRYLELAADGQGCSSSWLAKGGSQLFMREQDLQVGGWGWGGGGQGEQQQQDVRVQRGHQCGCGAPPIMSRSPPAIVQAV